MRLETALRLCLACCMKARVKPGLERSRRCDTHIFLLSQAISNGADRSVRPCGRSMGKCAVVRRHQTITRTLQQLDGVRVQEKETGHIARLNFVNIGNGAAHGGRAVDFGDKPQVQVIAAELESESNFCFPVHRPGLFYPNPAPDLRGHVRKRNVICHISNQRNSRPKWSRLANPKSSCRPRIP